MNLEKPSGPIVVLGASGQLGRALLRQLSSRGVGLSRDDANLMEVERIFPKLEALRPSFLINAAAYTKVDRAEEEKDLAEAINAQAPAKLASWASANDVPFVHYSTDYVFSGEGSTAWSETDIKRPLNVYGMTKARGEDLIQSAGGRFLILRTSWLFDEIGPNFVNTILRLGHEQESVRVVNDQFGSPTYAKDLASATLQLLSTSDPASFPSGIFHLTNSGETSWHGFASKIVEMARNAGMSLRVQEVIPISSTEYPQSARRPRNSRLSNRKIRDNLGISLRPWNDALKDCLIARQAQIHSTHQRKK